MKPLLSVTAWKFVLVSLALFFGTLTVWSLSTWARAVDPAVAGTLGASLEDDIPGALKVTSLDADSALRRAGVAVGDRLRFDHPGDRRRLIGTDETIGLTVWRGVTSQHIEVKPAPDLGVREHRQLVLVAYVLEATIGFWTLLLGTVAGLRHAKSPAMRAFALALIAVTTDIFGGLPGGSLQTILVQFDRIEFFVVYAGLAYFALRYAEDAAPWRQPWVRRGFTAYLSALLASVLYSTAFRIGALPAGSPPMSESVLEIFSIVSVAIIWSALAWSWSRATGIVRQRLAWIGVSMGLVYGTYLMINLGPLVGLFTDNPWVDFVQAAVMFAAYVGLGYGLLRHRIFDIGFAINRTVVFTVLSTLLLLVFALTEFAVDKLLHFEGREKNVIFDAVVALGVILTFHRIQHWVGHQVDNTLFRKWHDAAKALRHAMDKAAHIVEQAVLLERVSRAMEVFASGAGFAIYRSVDGAGFELQHSTLVDAPPLLGPDEDALLEMRSAGSWVYLNTSNPDARGTIAFPMLSRGRLQGLVIAGNKGSGNLYRPDELSLLAISVQQLGQYLEALRAGALAQHALVQEQRAEALATELHAKEREAMRLQRLLELRLVGSG